MDEGTCLLFKLDVRSSVELMIFKIRDSGFVETDNEDDIDDDGIEDGVKKRSNVDQSLKLSHKPEVRIPWILRIIWVDMMKKRSKNW